MARRKVTFQPSDGKSLGRWYANVGTLTIDGRKFNCFVTFLRKDLDKFLTRAGKIPFDIAQTRAFARIKLEPQTD